MKKTFFAMAMMATFTLAAMAADSAKASQHYSAGDAGKTITTKIVPASIVPVCSKRTCSFYGGDLNPSDTNAAGLSDENTLFIPGSNTYGTITPAANTTVHGIFFNVQISAIPTAPFTGSYDIRSGVTDGNGGTEIQSSNGSVTAYGKVTGRSFLGLTEFSVIIPVTPAVALTAGTSYSFNVTADCLNSSDANCSSGRMFASNTTQQTNGINTAWEPAGQLFLNSAFFGFTYANWCDGSLGLNAQQCADLSFGLF